MEQLKAEDLPTIVHEQLTWEDWQKRWKEVTDLPTALGLLHTVLDTKIDESQRSAKRLQRLLFLIQLADGHANSEADGYIIHSLRSKAFAVLVQNVFKYTMLERFQNLGHEVVQALIWFFRASHFENGRYWKSNANFSAEEDARHQTKITTEFLKSFCQYLWNAGHGAAMEYKIAALNLLHENNGLLLLLPRMSSIGWEWRKFTPEVMKRLEELALSDADSIEQAIFKGSNAARLFIQVKAALTEIERQNEREELEKQVRQAQARLEKLK